MTKTASALRLQRWFKLGRHDVRSTLPAAIQAIMQNGLLDRAFQNALLPQFLYPAVADTEPWDGAQGDTRTFTRTGLLAPMTTPLAGADASAATYGIEQWSVTMDQYGQSVDTNMVQSAMTLASKFLQDVNTLGINAGQSVNQIARNKLYNAYMGGRTWCTTAGASDTSIIVNSVAGFQFVLVNGVPTPVSATNPLSITINGVANTVTAVNAGTLTLTLGTARADVIGDYLVASNAATSLRPNSRNTAYEIQSTDLATLALFRSAVVRLRKQNVPTIGGYYTAHIPPDTEGQLFADADFKQALQGRVDSPIYRDLSIGRFAGIDWVRNNEAPTILGGSAGNIVVQRPILLGDGALVNCPFTGMGSLLQDADVSDVPGIRMIGPATGVQVALIVRPPQDRLQQNISTTWSWIGDFGVPADSVAGDTARFKRGVVVEHAS